MTVKIELTAEQAGVLLQIAGKLFDNQFKHLGTSPFPSEAKKRSSGSRKRPAPVAEKVDIFPIDKPSVKRGRRKSTVSV